MGHDSAWFQTGHAWAGRVGRLVAVGTLLILASSTTWGQTARPAAKAAGSQAASLARYVPSQNLMFYLEFDGVDAHATAWRASAAYKLLNDTKLGPLVEDLASQGIELAQQSVAAAKRIKGVEVVGLLKYIARRGFVVAVAGKNPDDALAVLVLRGGDRPEIRRLLTRMSLPGEANDRDRQAAPARFRKGGRTLTFLDKSRSWWVEKGDLIVATNIKLDDLLAVVDGKQPNAVNHPLRTELPKAESGFEPVATGFLDIAALPPMPPAAIKLGLDGIKRVDLRWGFQDDALMGVYRVVAPAPRKGALALLDQPTLGITSLPPLPSTLTGFSAVSIDLVKTYDQIVALAKLASSEGDARVKDFETRARRRLDLELRGDLFRIVGPKLALYAQPAPEVAGAKANPALAFLSQFTGLTISVQVRDQVAAGNAVDSLIESINSALKEQRQPAGANANAPALQFQKMPGPRHRYEMDFAASGIRGPAAELYQPTVMVGEHQLVISATPAAAERALDSSRTDQRWRPTGAFRAMAQRLPQEVVFLNVSDLRESLPALIENLPTTLQGINAGIANVQRQGGKQGGGIDVQIDPNKVPSATELRRLLFPASAAAFVDRQGLSVVVREPIPSISSPSTMSVVVALVLPAVQAAREAARRAQCVNNLKQIGTAFQSYRTSHKAFPQAAITDKLGRPLLSWRVAILPYIGQQSLYNKFKRNEAWDTPNNIALLKEMPSIYGCLSRSNAEPFTTNYQVFVGEGAMFENRQDISLFGVTDDTSSTLLVVEAKQSVPWTKPADLTFDPAAAPSLYGAGSSHPGIFNAVFLDGSVRSIKLAIDPKVFRALITRHGREVINAEAF
jgi:hypothetical protein